MPWAIAKATKGSMVPQRISSRNQNPIHGSPVVARHSSRLGTANGAASAFHASATAAATATPNSNSRLLATKVCHRRRCSTGGAAAFSRCSHQPAISHHRGNERQLCQIPAGIAKTAAAPHQLANLSEEAETLFGGATCIVDCLRSKSNICGEICWN